MFAEPKVIARVLLLLELILPVVNVFPFRLSVPWVKVKEPLVPKLAASAKVTVIPDPLIFKLLVVFPTLVSVPEAINVVIRDVYVPPVERVRFPQAL